MGRLAFVWDLEGDPDGNYWHICVEGHGVTREEVEEVLAANYETATLSRSSGQPEAFGWTASGKYLTVVFEKVSDDPLTVYPITAYEAMSPMLSRSGGVFQHSPAMLRGRESMPPQKAEEATM